MANYDYAWEKLYGGVRHLATSQEPLKLRLAGAYPGTLNSEDFPLAIRDRWSGLKDAMLRIDGNPEASVAAMDDDEIERYALTLVDLFDLVCRALAVELIGPGTT